MSEKDINKDLLSIGLFIIFDGLLFHDVISSHQTSINSLKTAPSLTISHFINEEWEKILKIDYRPVFDLAHSVFLSFPSSPETNSILKKLLDSALHVTSAGALLNHDLMGRLYHKLLLRTTKKYYATYYTSIPAAGLLSNLTVKSFNPDLKWNFENLESLKGFKALDPACGSGTLISGIYMALKDKYIMDRYCSDRPAPLRLDKFHKMLIEETLIGWDVLDYAGHLTLTTLGLHNPKSTFKSANIYTLQIGKDNNKIRLGSLDYLDDQRDLIGIGFGSAPRRKGIQREITEIIKLPKESVDIVIMNPPFSRSAGTINTKFGFEKDEEIKKRMNSQLRKFGSDCGFSGIGHAGLGAYFAILGNKLIKQGGRLSLVIPRAILSGVSWEKIRKKLFLENYEIEYIVSNYDPGEKELNIEPWNWSERTSLSEVLLVARKTKRNMKDRITTFINLWNKPKNEIESLKITSDSIKAREKDGLELLDGGSYEILKLDKEIGVAYNVKHKYLEDNFLIPCLFANPSLNRLTSEIVFNNLIPLIKFKKLVSNFGVDRKQIQDNFKLVTHKTLYPILWGAPKSLNTMNLTSYKYSFPKSKKQKAENIYERKGNLLISGTFYLHNSSILALYSEEAILSTIFWEILIDPQDAKMLTLWFNSTFGFLVMLGHSISSYGDWFNLKKNQLEEMPILDILKLSNSNKNELVNLFDDICNEEFKEFPKEFEIASINRGIRKKIDDIFIKNLGLKINLIPFYEMLYKEPIISLKRM